MTSIELYYSIKLIAIAVSLLYIIIYSIIKAVQK